MSRQDDFSLDRRVVRRRFAQHAEHAEATGFLAREVATRMAERLGYIRYEPARVLDFGCGLGRDFALLAQHYPGAEHLGVDVALPLLQRARRSRSLVQRLLPFAQRAAPRLVCADGQALPLRGGSVQMVWSNLALNWFADPLPPLGEMNRVLDVGGMLMFSTLGPDTLKELRAVLPAESGERVHRFIDMHDLGDALLRAGFAEPVMDMETITLTYRSLDGMLTDLRRSGATNASTARPRGLSGRAGWARARTAYEALRREDGLPATFEIVFGHAWKAAPKTAADGRAIVRFQPKVGR